MSDYSGPGLYEIIPSYAQDMSLNVWGDAKTAGTQVKLYPRSKTSTNTHFEIIAAGGYYAKPEIGDREYHIIAGNSGLYLTSNGKSKAITTELRAPLDSNIRWKLVPVGNGAFRINNVDGETQFNMNDYGKTQGTEIIGYSFLQDANTEFLLKAVE